MYEPSLAITSEDLRELIDKQINRYKKLRGFLEKSRPLQRRIAILEESGEELPLEERKSLVKKYRQFLRRINSVDNSYAKVKSLTNLYGNFFHEELPEEVENIIDEMRDFSFYATRKLEEMFSDRIQIPKKIVDYSYVLKPKEN